MNAIFFTAAEIARCLDCTPQNVRKALHGIPADAQKIVSGVQTRAWSFSLLPSPILQRLSNLASKLGFRTPLQLLQNAPRREPTLPLSSVAPHEIERAQKLQRGLRTAFMLPPETSIAELARVAAPNYTRELGHVSDRHLRALISRVLNRDGGARNFDRLDLYLSDSPATNRRRAPLDKSLHFEELDEVFAQVFDRNKPTLSEIAHCWRAVVSLVNDRIAAGQDEIKLKQQLRAYIGRVAAFLGATPAAVKRTLNRKMRKAIDGGGIDQITDSRLRPNRSVVGKTEFAADIKLLVRNAAFYCGGRLAQAYRQLQTGTFHTGDRFSEAFRAAYPFDVRKAKSEVPKSIRRIAAPAIAALKPHILGPRATRLALPSIHRDWSQVAAGDSYTSDDVTLNHYVVDWREDGIYEYDGRCFNVDRPQFLPVVDERTGCPLGFSLIPDKSYNSWQIRTLISRICMRQEIGLPFKQFLFELAIWQSRNVEELARWPDIDESFARAGVQLRLRHATTPKAKVIEQVIGQFQNLDEFAPGYAGRGEQRVKFERVRNFLSRLKRVGQPRKAEVNPVEMLMTMDECAQMLENVMRQFANEPQNGERLQGLSPAEGWQQLSNGRAHIVLPESLRYLLGTSESTQTVTPEGIMLRIGRVKRYYCGSEKLGALIGEKVRVRYNPELPEQITVSHIASDPLARNPFAVPFFERLPAHIATRDEFAVAREHQNRFASYARVLYRELAPSSNKTWSSSQLGSSNLRAAGEAHNRLERAHVDLTERRERERGSIVRLAASQNLAIDARKVRKPERVKKHLESSARLRQRILELEQEAAAKPKEKSA